MNTELLTLKIYVINGDKSLNRIISLLRKKGATIKRLRFTEIQEESNFKDDKNLLSLRIEFPSNKLENLKQNLKKIIDVVEVYDLKEWMELIKV